MVSRVARADDDSLRHVERHAMDDLQAMRLWNWRPTAASIATQAMSPCADLSLRATSIGSIGSTDPKTDSPECL